jgi:DNA-binding NarL/FixJ family response regulator
LGLRVLLIDDHPVFRDALAGIVQRIDPLARVAQASSAEDGLQQLQEHGAPDLVVVDLQLPGMDGIAAIQVLRASHPQLPVAVVSADEDPQRAVQALQAGATAWVPKSAPAAEMAAALRALLAGAMSAAAPGSTLQADDEGADKAALTLRQVEVLKLVADGLSNKHIARQLQLTEKTVKAHLTRVFRFLGVVNRTQALRAAQRLGLVAASPR